jgi:hypothetical protein
MKCAGFGEKERFPGSGKLCNCVSGQSDGTVARSGVTDPQLLPRSVYPYLSTAVKIHQLKILSPGSSSNEGEKKEP